MKELLPNNFLYQTKSHLTRMAAEADLFRMLRKKTASWKVFKTKYKGTKAYCLYVREVEVAKILDFNSTETLWRGFIRFSLTPIKKHLRIIKK